MAIEPIPAEVDMLIIVARELAGFYFNNRALAPAEIKADTNAAVGG